MFTSTRTHAGHTRRFTVKPREAGAEGWEAREEHDSRVVRTVHYSDWHRVERAIELFERTNRDDRGRDGYSTNR